MILILEKFQEVLLKREAEEEENSKENILLSKRREERERVGATAAQIACEYFDEQIARIGEEFWGKDSEEEREKAGREKDNGFYRRRNECLAKAMLDTLRTYRFAHPQLPPTFPPFAPFAGQVKSHAAVRFCFLSSQFLCSKCSIFIF